MDSCEKFILGGVICALAGVGVMGICWRLRRPLVWAQQYDKTITEDGLYGVLPIYGYLRRYLVALLFTGAAIFLASVLVPILVFSFSKLECGTMSRVAQPIFTLLTALLCAHVATIALYEIHSFKHRHGKLTKTKRLVENLRNRMWGSALFLLLAVAVLGVMSAVG